MTGKSHFSPIRVLDTSLPASGSVYMNERPKMGSKQGGLNVHLWVSASEMLFGNSPICRSDELREMLSRQPGSFDPWSEKPVAAGA